MPNGRQRLGWTETAIRLAQDIACYRSEDNFVQVGACGIKYDGSILLGYNGAPPGVEIDWADRQARRKRVVHAESNVLNFAKPNEVKLLAVTHIPCPECVKLIAMKRIKEVYYINETQNYDRELTIQLAEEFGVKIHKYESK